MKLREFFLFFILISTTYQDFPLINYFGEIARSPIIFLTPLFILYFIKIKKIFIPEYSKILIFYISYLFLITVTYSFFLIVKNQSIYFLDENILIKNIKMICYPICVFLFYIFTYNFLKRTKDFNQIFKAIFCVQVLLIIILIFEVNYYKTKEVFLSFLHSSNDKYWRIRLLTLESSWSGSVVIIFTFLPVFLAMFLKKSRGVKFIIYSTSIFFFIYYTLHSESKGYLLVLLISVFPMLIGYTYKNKRLRKLLILLLVPITIISIFVISYLKGHISENLYRSITFGTRFSGYLASLKTFFTNPFGVGLGPYVKIFSDNLYDVLNTEFMQNFNLNEVSAYLYSSNKLSSKTYFFDNLVFGGLPFLLFFYLFFIRRYRKLKNIKNNYILRIVLIFVILGGVFYLTFNIKYEIWFFLAFIDVFENKLNEKA